MGENLFTFQSLVTMGGSACVVFLITQTFKEALDTRLKMPTKLFSTIVAFVVLLGATIGTGADVLSWKTYFIALINAFIVSATAGKMFDDASKQGGATVEKQ